MGIEANFTDPADTVASITQNIPLSIGQLQIFGGSLTIQGNQKAAALFRIAIIGDAAGGDGGLGPGSVLILNHVLNVPVANLAPFLLRRSPSPVRTGPFQCRLMARRIR